MSTLITSSLHHIVLTVDQGLYWRKPDNCIVPHMILPLATTVVEVVVAHWEGDHVTLAVAVD